MEADHFYITSVIVDNIDTYRKRKTSWALILVLLFGIILLAGCSGGDDSSDTAADSSISDSAADVPDSSADDPSADTSDNSADNTTDETTDTSTSDSAADASDSSTDDSSADTSDDSADISTDETTDSSNSDSAEDATDSGTDDSPADPSNENSVSDSPGAASILLAYNSVTVSGTGAAVAGSKITITAAGTYTFSGTLTDGQIIVDTEDEDAVNLILNGIDITSSTGAPISILNAEETIITLADNTQNDVTDAGSYIFDDPEEDEPNAAVFSKDDLTILGGGTLTVDANYNDGIASKDDLLISGGTIIVDSVDDGIRGKDSLIIEDGTITVTASGDGLKSDNDEDAEKGYISIQSGDIHITSGGDAIQAETDVIIQDGDITISSGGGSDGIIEGDESAKGIKGGVTVSINTGNFIIDTADDAVHSNGSIFIEGANFEISSGDDGIHADASVEINNGEIVISEAYEGIEGAVITINDGNIHITASDDGINVAGGTDTFGLKAKPGMDGMPGQDNFGTSSNYFLYINGGYIVVDADGDGIDSNGSVEMTDGIVLVHGPTSNKNGALDHFSFTISGGLLVAAGSSGMATAPGTTSGQNSVMVNFNTSMQAGVLFHIQDSAGREMITFAPSKTYQSVVFSSPNLNTGASYDIYYGGSSTGTLTDGLYENGIYTPGTQYSSFTVSESVTILGDTGSFQMH